MKARIIRVGKTQFWAIVTIKVTGDVREPFNLDQKVNLPIGKLSAFKECFRIS